MAVALCFVILVVQIKIISFVYAHGVLVDPPARNHMGKAGFNVPVDYYSIGLNCGGYRHQWNVNNGRCGVCGNPYDGPRTHEPPGRYATGIIGRCVNSRERILTVTVALTAHHQGYFEFRLCPHNNPKEPVSQDCLNRHLLTVVGTNDGTRYDVSNDERAYYNFALELPTGVTCTHCVLQWFYNTGNSWGCNETACGIGLGPQEQFINCADIAIAHDCNFLEIGQPVQVRKRTAFPEPLEEDDANESAEDGIGDADEEQETTVYHLPTRHIVNKVPTRKTSFSNRDGYTGYKMCVATLWKGLLRLRLTAWCLIQCNYDPPYCPETHCVCYNV